MIVADCSDIWERPCVWSAFTLIMEGQWKASRRLVGWSAQRLAEMGRRTLRVQEKATTQQVDFERHMQFDACVFGYVCIIVDAHLSACKDLKT